MLVSIPLFIKKSTHHLEVSTQVMELVTVAIHTSKKATKKLLSNLFALHTFYTLDFIYTLNLSLHIFLI
jgi:hypothetical protein